VTVRDAFDNLVSGATVTLSATGTGNTLTPSRITDVNGQITGTLSSIAAETKTITATVGAVTITQTASVTVDPAPATQLAFTVQPSRVLVGGAITPAVVVTARDPFGNTASAFADNVLIAIGHDGAVLPPATLGGTLTVAAVSGVASFGNLNIDRLGVGYTLAASSGVLSGASSAPFDVVSVL
jgi:hypothetical protein